MNDAMLLAYIHNKAIVIIKNDSISVNRLWQKNVIMFLNYHIML